jgi:hypothetical protein
MASSSPKTADGIVSGSGCPTQPLLSNHCPENVRSEGWSKCPYPERVGREAGIYRRSRPSSLATTPARPPFGPPMAANHKRQGLLVASLMQASWQDKSRYMSCAHSDRFRPCSDLCQKCSMPGQRLDWSLVNTKQAVSRLMLRLAQAP